MSPEFQENIEEYFVANIKVDITIGSFSSRSEHIFFVLWLSHERPCKCQMLIKNDQSWEGSNTRLCYQPDATRTVPRPEHGAMSVLIVGHWSHQGLKLRRSYDLKQKLVGLHEFSEDNCLKSLKPPSHTGRTVFSLHFWTFKCHRVKLNHKRSSLSLWPGSPAGASHYSAQRRRAPQG